MHRFDQRIIPKFAALIMICGLALFSGCSDKTVEPAVPVLNVSDTALSVSGALDLTGPPEQRIILTATQHGIVNYEAYIKSTNDRRNPWMRLLNETGTTPDSLFVRFSMVNVEDGIFIDTIVITSEDVPNSPIFIEVTMTLLPVLKSNKAALDFVLLSGSTISDTQFVEITSNGEKAFQYTIETTRPWLRVDKSSGTGPDTIGVIADPTGQQQMIDTGTVMITSEGLFGSPQLVTCAVVISAWAPQKGTLAQDLAGVYFIDDQRGWAVGRIASVSEVTGYILQTVDGGLTWNQLQLAPSVPLGAVEMVDPTTGWIIGGDGLVLKTTNGGQTWNGQSTPAVEDRLDIWDIDAVSTQFACVVGPEGLIMTTHDGGANWIYRESGVDFALSEVSFVDDEYGWIVGNQGVILHSTDGGLTWNHQDSPATNDLRGVHFIDRNEGWAVGKFGRILHTTNSGQTWETVGSPTNDLLQSVQFVGTAEGWIVGNNGVILHTNDGGATWVEQESNTDRWLRSLYFLNTNVGWVVGEKGVILHTISGGL